MTVTMKRADALRMFAIAGAGFSLGIELLPRAGAAAPAAPDFSPLVWLKMHPNGTTTVVLNHIEMGQGITTGLPMMLADELDIPFSSVSFELSPVAPAYYSPFWHGIFTAGSKSTPTMGPVMRKAGATARAMLVAAAAQRWGVDPSGCAVADGIVIGPPGSAHRTRRCSRPPRRCRCRPTFRSRRPISTRSWARVSAASTSARKRTARPCTAWT
jgi:isoquinoline 1-oxidoreductase beta subunit